MKKYLKGLGIFFVILAIIFLCFWFYLYLNYTTPIFMYHSLDKNKVGSYAAVDIEVFRQQMKFIKEKGFKVLSLDEYCRMLTERVNIPHKTVVITFDDGYKDNLAGIRFLKAIDFPATIFVIVDKIGQDGYLSREDIAWFLKNTKVKIGSHGVSSAYLPDVDDLTMKQEINNSKRELEAIFSRKVNTITYPIGGFDQRVLKEVGRADYLCACTTNRGFSRELDPFALRRIKITNRDLGFRLWAKLSGFYNIFKKPKNPY